MKDELRQAGRGQISQGPEDFIGKLHLTLTIIGSY